MKSELLLAVIVCLLPATAWALINPEFTPIHLTDQSRTILTARLKGKPVGDELELEVLAVLKGKAAPGKLKIELSEAPRQHAEAARRQFAWAAGRTLLLFAGKYEDRELAYLHVRGTWMRLTGGGEGTWQFLAIDDNMPGTWAGGTDMLLRCVQYILACGADAFVPVDSGTAWRSVVQVGAVKPKATAAVAVDLAGDGRLCLYVASPNGDRLFRPVAGKEGFQDITATVNLAARSLASAWGDFDGDGRVDLASFDGKTLTLWKQQAPPAAGTQAGVTFKAAPAAGKFTIAAACPGLATLGLGKGAPPALVVSGAAPQLLKPAGPGAFEGVALPAPQRAAGKLGKAQAGLVADFTNDGIADLLQPFEKGGLLYPGRKDGSFAPPKPCGVDCTAGGGRAAAGDFDEDGWPDVLVAGAEGVKVFQNLHDGTFQEAMALSGEVSYKAQPFASWCGVCDFNNDCRQDIFLTYESQPLLLYFNRGFRSFGQAPKLELGLSDVTEMDSGQQMGVFADFDDDGAEDFVIVMPKGQIWCAYNDLGGQDALCVQARLSPKSPFAGPVTVTAWQKSRCLGARQVRVGAAPAWFGIRDAGPYTLKWRFPGGTWQERTVTVEDAPVKVVLDTPGKTPAAKPAEKPK